MVEDNPGDVVLLQEALQNAGLPYSLDIAHDGVEALEYLGLPGVRPGKARPDLILLDMKLPRKTGMEVLDEIHLNSTLRDIPVIILSSSMSELKLAKSRWDPPYVCLVKPSTFEGYIELARTIEIFRKVKGKADES